MDSKVIKMIAEIFKMGNYGLYVWSAYGIVVFSLITLAYRSRRQYQQLKTELQEHLESLS